MDIFKAFDLMPHGLLIAKFYVYGLSTDACELLSVFLKNRRHRVKIMDARSEWITTGFGHGPFTI